MLPQITKFVKHLPVLMKHTQPAILTGIAVAGTVTTAVLSARGAFKASRILEDRNQETRDAEFTKREQFIDDFKTTWSCYVPAVAVGVATVACAIGSNRAGARQAAALASAYTLSERAFEEYREKVVEQLGKTKDQKVRDAVAQDQVTRTYADNPQVLINDDSRVPCYESLSGRYFFTTYESIRKAQNDFNEHMLTEGYGSLNDFWDKLGLEQTEMGENLGWTSDHLLEVVFSTTTMGEAMIPCLSISYRRSPDPNFWQFR